MKQKYLKMIFFSMFSILSFSCTSTSVEVKNEIFSRNDSSGASGGEWYILSDEKPFKIVDKVGFGQPGTEMKKLSDIGNTNLAYIQSSGWGNLHDTGNRWKFLKPEKVNGEIIVYLKKSEKTVIIKYNVTGIHENKLYNEYPALIKICEINGKQYSYTQDKSKIDKLQIAYEESLPENIAKRAELERFAKAKRAADEEEKLNEIYTKEEEQKRLQAWKADSNTIQSMIKGLRNIETENPNDSDLQREYKAELRKKKYNEEFMRIKKEYYNKPFSLQAAMVTEVKLETRLNKAGQKKRAEMENAFKTDHPLRDYLAVQFEKNRYTYEVETGNYEISFTIPVPESSGYSSYSHGIKKTGSPGNSTNTENRFNVNIIFIVKSKTKALQYSKEDVIPLTGKITEIKHGYSFMDEYVTIKIIE